MYGNTRAWFRVAYALLAFALVAAIAVGGLVTAKDVRVETRPVAAVVHSYQELENALGAPAQTVPGADINEALDGSTCGVWQLEPGVIIGCR